MPTTVGRRWGRVAGGGPVVVRAAAWRGGGVAGRGGREAWPGVGRARRDVGPGRRRELSEVPVEDQRAQAPAPHPSAPQAPPHPPPTPTSPGPPRRRPPPPPP